MKKTLILFISLFVLSSCATYHKNQPQVRFKAKGIYTKYLKDENALVYYAKWGGWLRDDNPLAVKIVEYGEKSGKYANTAWLEVSISRSGNGYVGMEYVKFYYSDQILSDKINLEEIFPVRRSVNYNVGSDTYSDYWCQAFRGISAKEWANKFIHLAKTPIRIINTGDGDFDKTSIQIYGKGSFYDSYYFTEKDKAQLKVLAEAWLKYFDNPQQPEESTADKKS